MNMERFERLLAGYGPSGREGPVRAILEETLSGHVDSLTTDALGNLIAVKRGDGTGRRILVAAHADHIGLAVVDADENGFLRVCAVGGVRAAGMVSQHVVSSRGVCGVVGADGDAKAELKIEQLYIDIGASTREEALLQAEIGEIFVARPRVSRLGGHRIAAPAMDDRVACAVLAEAMLALPDGLKNEVTAVFTVQEEVGTRGAGPAAYALRPDMGLALDVTLTGDTPQARPKLPVRLGGGAAVKIMDRSAICAPQVVSLLMETAQREGIDVQREVLPAGGTDAGAIQRVRGGVPAGVISIPCRYVHSAAETVDLRDVEAALALLLAVLQTAE